MAPAPHAGAVSILHLSDTHGLHRAIESKFGVLPRADILIITGDFTDSGRLAEFKDFNAWLGELRARGSFAEIVAITGNHEWKRVKRPDDSADSAYMIELASRADYAAGLRKLLSNANVLEHETVDLFGIRLFGSSWCPWQDAGNPDKVIRNEACDKAAARWKAAGHSGPLPWEAIPEDIDILLTHGPPFGIFDQMECTSHHWGGSRSLRARIEQVRPTVHLFGHLHEQRGIWWRPVLESGEYHGGVEYAEVPPCKPLPPPPPEYPCQLVSCNAMMNHPNLEGTRSCIAGPGRLFVAERADESARWSFRPA
eukprot:TRINITY_DN8622_c0_g1_i1.p1 TRINITY_DN8622_c0_g1~~TRINITY_DN8622_c0_g1_i1.p1  ORF type:complete len:311 (+),score=37.68 TRINITY_DN8622_c0_g1_i1:117-1049(+)